jgi:Uma2 family endonuclease
MTYTIDIRAFTDSISDRALEQLCRENPELKFETDIKGKLIVMSPTGSESGKRNAGLVAQIWYWNNQYKLCQLDCN